MGWLASDVLLVPRLGRTGAPTRPKPHAVITMSLSFHDDTKFCPSCDTYVRYLSSIDRSYCVDCGGEVRLLSESDWAKFQEQLEARKPKGGRPRKKKSGSVAA